mgnify:CR=1 FL=1|tara:strand:- start:2076 stop:2651 length:576 start_codon:yes stop_codon:yes gene_type:complete
MNKKIMVFKKKEFDGFIKRTQNKLNIYGLIKDGNKNKISEINYVAADPAENNYSFSGTGLPFHNFEQATTNRINIGKCKVINNEFKFTIQVPNSYYKTLGSLYIGPRVHIKSCNSDNYEIIELDMAIPYRYLDHPSINYYPSVVEKLYKPSDSNFYNLKLEQRSQEQILRDSAYPCEDNMPSNFWGSKPPL